VQIVRYHYRREFAITGRPVSATFEISLDQFEIRSIQEVDDTGIVAVNSHHMMASLQKQSGMTPGSTGDIENCPGRNKFRESAHPIRGRRIAVRFV